MKICVYAICKNEEKFVDAWVESMSEADYVCVLDTGSTDNTYVKLKKYPNVIVSQKIIYPWRFDVARNESMALIPKDADLCLCVDLDERFDKGWRKILESGVNSDTQQVYYKYVWNFKENGTEGVTFFANKIHSRNGFVWKYPVHEIIVPVDNGVVRSVTIKDLQLNHYADNTKSRSQYLPLLELSVKEDKTSDRNMHYLGREYYFYGQYDNAIKTLKKHLKMKNAVWADERCASLRYIAKCYMAKGDNANAIKFLKLAILEKPTNREPYYDLAQLYYIQKKYLECAVMIESMLNITNRELNYISNPEC